VHIQHRVVVVVRPPERQRELEPLERRGRLAELALEVRLQAGALGFARLGAERRELRRLLQVAFEFAPRRDERLSARRRAQQLLRTALVLPQVGVGALRAELC